MKIPIEILLTALVLTLLLSLNESLLQSVKTPELWEFEKFVSEYSREYWNDEEEMANRFQVYQVKLNVLSPEY